MSASQPPSLSDVPASPFKPTLFDLFRTFALISLYGFGGVLAWSRRMIVEVRGWMTPEEFNEAYALCQFLPGPNVVNLSVVFGSRIRGPLGALAALFGLLGPPMLIVILIGVLYAHYGEVAALQRALAGMAAAAAGLVIGTVAKMAQPLFRGGLSAAPFVALATFVGVGVMRWPLLWVLAAMFPLSIALTYWVRR
jgi:chromate transporter